MLYEELQDKEFAAKLLARQNPNVQSELFVKFPPVGAWLPKPYAEHYDTIRNLDVRQDDVYVLGIPKSGSTWTQEMVWLLGHDLDYEGAKVLLSTRFPHLEVDFLRVSNVKGAAPTTIDVIKNAPSPRYIKSHVHWQLLPKQIETKKPKVIYVARNPKDQCVSYFHFKGLISGYEGTMDDFVEEFIADYYVGGPYWAHISEFWNRKNEPNILFVRYEDMKKDLPGMVRKTAEFLGKSYTDEQYAKLVEHLSFDSMKKNSAVNNEKHVEALTKFHGKPKTTDFIRKGKVGSWREELSPESVEKLDDWIARTKIDGIWENL